MLTFSQRGYTTVLKMLATQGEALERKGS